MKTIDPHFAKRTKDLADKYYFVLVAEMGHLEKIMGDPNNVTAASFNLAKDKWSRLHVIKCALEEAHIISAENNPQVNYRK